MELSQDLSAAEAVEAIEQMTSQADIEMFINGEQRKTVLAAAEGRILKLADVPAPPAPKPEGKEELFSITVAKAENEPDYVPVNIDGTNDDGKPVQYRMLLQRGVKVHNVPKPVVHALKNAVKTVYRPVKKPDGSGNELRPEQVEVYPTTVLDGPYFEPKPQE